MFTRLLNILKEHRIIYCTAALLIILPLILLPLFPYLTFMLICIFTGGVCLFLYGILLHFKQSSRVARVLYVIALCGAAVFVISFIILELLITYPPKTDKNGGEVLIVLGCGTKDGNLTATARSRADAAIEYLSENEKCIAVVCGAKDSDEIITEAEAMYSYITKNGIAGERILLEKKSRDTTQNISFAKEILTAHGIDVKTCKVGVATSDFHLYRSLLIMKKQGFENTFAIGAKVPDTPLLKTSLSVREYFSLILEFFGI